MLERDRGCGVGACSFATTFCSQESLLKRVISELVDDNGVAAAGSPSPGSYAKISEIGGNLEHLSPRLSLVLLSPTAWAAGVPSGLINVEPTKYLDNQPKLPNTTETRRSYFFNAISEKFGGEDGVVVQGKTQQGLPGFDKPGDWWDQHHAGLPMGRQLERIPFTKLACARDMQVGVTRTRRSHASPLSHAPPLSHASPLSHAPPRTHASPLSHAPPLQVATLTPTYPAFPAKTVEYMGWVRKLCDYDLVNEPKPPVALSIVELQSVIDGSIEAVKPLARELLAAKQADEAARTAAAAQAPNAPPPAGPASSAPPVRACVRACRSRVFGSAERERAVPSALRG